MACQYHGGPGSNYSGHGLCAVVEKLRTDAFRGKFGCVGANGGWLTEHSVGYIQRFHHKNVFRGVIMNLMVVTINFRSTTLYMHQMVQVKFLPGLFVIIAIVTKQKPP